MARLRDPKRAAMNSTTEASRSSGTFITAAMASGGLPWGVGPRPPPMITPSERASAVRRARTMRAWLSPTAWWKWESTPAAANCSPSQAELVSAIWPSRSSAPTATISTLTPPPPISTGGPSHGPAPVEQVLDPGHHREGGGEPHEGELQGVGAGQRRGPAGGGGKGL